MSTPGHTKGHISIYLPGSSAESAEKFRALDAKTIICYHGGVGDMANLSS